MTWEAYVWPDGRIDTVIDWSKQRTTWPVKPKGCRHQPLSGPPRGVAPYRLVGSEAIGDLDEEPMASC